MKKIICVILSLITIASAFFCVDFSAFAADDIETGYCNDEKSVYYTFNKTTGEMTVGGTGVLKHSPIQDKNDCDYLKHLTIESGITKIGRVTFKLCKQLETVTILGNTLDVIESSAFVSCKELKEINIPESTRIICNDVFFNCPKLVAKVYSRNVKYDDNFLIFSTSAKIYGYSGSTTQTYCKRLGKYFVDIESGKVEDNRVTNNDIVKLLPTDLEAALPVSFSATIRSKTTKEFLGYQPNIFYEPNPDTNENYLEILHKAQDITKDCKTDIDKVNAISHFVASYLKYAYGAGGGNTIDSIYSTYNLRYGNCMASSELIAFMLYLINIPAALINTYDHQYAAALIDGVWYKVSTGCDAITDFNSDYYSINAIAYSTLDYYCMIIDTLDGPRFAGVGGFDCDYPYDYINLPDNTATVSPESFHCLSRNIYIETVNGKKGMKCEQWFLDNWECMVYEGKTFTSRKSHTYDSTTLEDNIEYTVKKYTCRYCGNSYECAEDKNRSGWVFWEGDWYYYRSPHEKVTGEFNNYYFNEEGKMQTGWQIVNGQRRYYNEDGGCAFMQWIKFDGKWYFLNDNSELATGWLNVDNAIYYLDKNGVMQTGWQKIDGYWYYFKSSGAMVKGWQKIGGKWYFFDDWGEMLTGWLWEGSKSYYLKDSGAMATGWQKIGGSWYYFRSNGEMQTGWLKSGGKWYYLDGWGEMLANTSKRIGGKTYKFNSSGACTNP